METEANVSSELQQQLHFLTEENVQLRSKVIQQSSSSRDLSTKLVQSQEDKLKISKDLVETQIEANKMREKYEKEIFELKNKVLSQESVVFCVEAESERLKLEAESLRAELRVTQGRSRDLEEEHQSLKQNFLSVCEALEREITHSDELQEELLNLTHTHHTHLQERQRSHTHTLQLERVKTLLSHTRVRPDNLRRNSAENKLIISPSKVENELREELEKMRRSYKEQQERLEEKIVTLAKQQQQNNRVLNLKHQESIQQSETLISSQLQMKELEAENSKLQNQLKKLNQEYRARLTHYIHDITECVRGVCEGDVSVRLKQFVDSMLKEVRESYRSREEQLSRSVRTYTTNLKNLNNTHTLLLISYRMQREQILARADLGLDAGPPETSFRTGQSHISAEPETQLQNLENLEKQLRAAQEQVAVLSQSSQRLSDETWTDIRNQIRDIVNTTQESQERERLQLISRTALAEQQVCELQEYVDNHLGRYKLEVTRLRRMLGLEAELSQSAELLKPLPPHTSLKNTSNEI